MTLFIGGCKNGKTMPTDGRDFYQHLGLITPEPCSSQSYYEQQIYKRHVIRSENQDIELYVLDSIDLNDALCRVFDNEIKLPEHVPPDWRHPFTIPEDYYS